MLENFSRLRKKFNTGPRAKQRALLPEGKLARCDIVGAKSSRRGLAEQLLQPPFRVSSDFGQIRRRRPPGTKLMECFVEIELIHHIYDGAREGVLDNLPTMLLGLGMEQFSLDLFLFFLRLFVVVGGTRMSS